MYIIGINEISEEVEEVEEVEGEDNVGRVNLSREEERDEADVEEPLAVIAPPQLAQVEDVQEKVTTTEFRLLITNKDKLRSLLVDHFAIQYKKGN